MFKYKGFHLTVVPHQLKLLNLNTHLLSFNSSLRLGDLVLKGKAFHAINLRMLVTQTLTMGHERLRQSICSRRCADKPVAGSLISRYYLQGQWQRRNYTCHRFPRTCCVSEAQLHLLSALVYVALLFYLFSGESSFFSQSNGNLEFPVPGV